MKSFEKFFTGRTHAIWRLYSKIAFSGFDRFSALWPEYLRANQEFETYDSKEYIRVRDDSATAGIETIVFSALTLEALVYDFGARNLGDEFAHRHLDKLDTPSKWVVTTQLVSGKEFPKSDHSYETMRRLFKTRNELVHAKSAALPTTNCDIDYGKLLASQDQIEHRFPEEVKNARESMVLVPKVVFQLFGDPLLVLHLPSDDCPIKTLSFP